MSTSFLYKLSQITKLQSKLVPELFYSRGLYYRIASKWQGFGMRMVIAMLILMQLPLATINYAYLSKLEKSLNGSSAGQYQTMPPSLELLWNNLPKFRLYPDRYELESEEMPVIIKSQNEGITLLAADTRNDPENLFKLEPQLLLTKQAIFVRPSLGMESDIKILPSQLWHELEALQLVSSADTATGVVIERSLISSLLSHHLGKLVAMISIYDIVTTLIMLLNYVVNAALLLMLLSITNKAFPGWSASIRTLNFAAVPGLIILTLATIAIRILSGTQFALLSATIWSYPLSIWVVTGYFIFAIYSYWYNTRKQI